MSEAALNNDAVNLTGIPMSDFIEKVHAFTPRIYTPDVLARL